MSPVEDFRIGEARTGDARSGDSVGGALRWAIERLSRENLADPAVEARALLSELLDAPPARLFLNMDATLPEARMAEYASWIERRARREPVAYIVGRKRFYGRDFAVDSRVLIPRPETELLVEQIVDRLRRSLRAGPKRAEDFRILELGAGSGCVSVTLALELPQSEVEGGDVSPMALAVARENAERLGAKNVRFFESDLFAAVPSEKGGYFDMIAANPPYVATPEMKDLEQDLSYEPRLALDGGPDGLSVIRRLVVDAPAFLREGGLIALEIGAGQGPAVEQALRAAGFSSVEILRDYAGHDRIALGEKRGPI